MLTSSKKVSNPLFFITGFYHANILSFSAALPTKIKAIFLSL
jgi:hypothetical protein